MGKTYQQFKASEKLEQEGIILDYGDFKIRVARAGKGNRKFKKAVERKTKPHRRAMQAGIMDEALAEKLMAECYAEAVIMGWEGVTDENDQEMPFTFDNCVKLLTDLPDLFADIQEQASALSNFREADQEADAKNS